MSQETFDRDIVFPKTDTPLRDDVRVLGALVGDILREQGGEELFERVETARTASIRHREGDLEAARTLEDLLRDLGPEAAEALVRAFSTYFQVVNLAETAHRLRRRRDYLRESRIQKGSLLDAVTRLAEAGLQASDAMNVLGRLLLEPVFTAHPTEAVRRTMLRKEQRIARRLFERMDRSITPPEEEAALGRIRAEVTAGWQTEEHPSARLTVADEREHVLFFLTEVLYEIVPPFYEALEDALEKVYRTSPKRLSGLLRFASWVGGDMDGNPNVSATTIRETLKRHRALVLKRYLAELNELYGYLSQTENRARFSEALGARITGDERYDEVISSMPPRHRDMPYRVLLTLMYGRIERTLEDVDGGYQDAPELLADLRLIAESLAAQNGEHAGLFYVRRTLRRVETFGFHLATLDVRQDADVHRRVIGEILGEVGWNDLGADLRTARLRRILTDSPQALPADTLASSETLDVFRAVADCLLRYGERAIGPYIISMAQGVDDVLSVLVLARWAGLVDADGHVPLDIAPLFETVPDLKASGGVMSALLADPVYRAHVASRGERQTVMIGYSDSNKDGGLAASRWALYRGQEILVEALAPSGVDITLFHGRGGTISRGGGTVSRAVQAMPPGALGPGNLRLTEQGEIINAKYGLRGIALRTLEQMASAVVDATATPPPRDVREARWREIMDEIARSSRDAYRALVYETPAFEAYFRQATPIDVIERLQIGSRPASRRQRQGIENLRAIPWVFAWTQSRHVLPGWYGLGTALEAALKDRAESELCAMASEWPYFSALLGDAEMVLAKADLRIAERYAGLAENREIFERIRDEFDRTVALILHLKKNEALLDDDPMLRRSIRLRNPYIDPMSLLQIDLLRRWRESDRGDDELLRALFATVNGIAQGLRNTG